MDVERVAITCVCIGKQWDARAFDERTAGTKIFVESQDAAIRPAEQVLRQAGAADRRRLVTSALDEPHAEAVEHARQDQNFRGLNHPAERASVGHCATRPGLRPAPGVPGAVSTAAAIARSNMAAISEGLGDKYILMISSSRLSL